MTNFLHRFAGLLLLVTTATAAFAQPIPNPNTASPKQAADFLRRMGAVITDDDQGNPITFQMPETIGLSDQAWPFVARLTTLQDLDLGGGEMTSERMKLLQPLTQVRMLSLFGGKIDSQSMANLVGMRELETLYLYRTPLDDSAIPWIAKLPKLTHLNMFDTSLTDKGLDHMTKCKKLQHVSLGNSLVGNFPESRFTEAGLERLRDALPGAIISIWGIPGNFDRPTVVAGPEHDKGQPKPPTKIPTAKPADDLAKDKTGHDWPGFLGPTGDSKSTETGLLTDWRQRLPKLVWHKKVGTGFAAPSISLGRLLLYHRVRTEDAQQRFQERLSCYQSETGNPLWQVDFPTEYRDINGYGDGPRCTPVIDNNRIYLFSPEGILRCLQLVDGKTIWEVDLASQLEIDLQTYGVGSTPVVHGNRLIVIAGGRRESTGDAGVVVLDKLTGVFQYGVGDDDASYASPRVVRSGNRNWAFAYMRDGLLVFDPDRGKVDSQFTWHSRVAGSVNAATPVVKDDQVFISESYSTGGVMLRFSDSSLTPIWQDNKRNRDKIMANHWATSIHHNGFLYGCNGRHSYSGTLKCVDWNTGAVRWEQEMKNRTSMVYADGHFFTLGENGALTVSQATPSGYIETGRIDKTNAEVLPSYPAWAAPVLAHGMLYVRGKNELICYDVGE